MSKFPNTVDNFTTKLNKRLVPYVIQDEVLNLVDGVGEKEFEHDNVKLDTIEIWSDLEKTGTKINSYILSQIPDSEWKSVIKVMCTFDSVYLTYETIGDQVEARDINDLQQSIVSTQTEILKHEADMLIHIENGVIDGGVFR